MNLAIKTLTSAALLFASTSVFAQAEITMSRSVKLTADEASSRVFHVTMPEDSVLVLNIQGNDRFSSLAESSSGIDTELDGKTAFFDFNHPGSYSVGASTVCGMAISVVADVYERTKEDKQKVSIDSVLPKVVIEAPEVCIL